ncbi:hypothetical protein C8R47DRAFT_745302 [Mycena vitilis]|nr:hypothetical protein C8R47DRAFT_745302 [Mycena vitilis]
MQTFTFDSERILKCTIQAADDSYTIVTVKHGSTRHHTTLKNSSGRACATINWHNRTFEIGGDTNSVDQLKRKASHFSLTRYWRWSGDGEEYRVKYGSNDAWTVTSSNGAVIASLTSSVEHPSGFTTLPVLHIARNIHDETERQFLLLVLLYSEAKRLDRLFKYGPGGERANHIDSD